MVCIETVRHIYKLEPSTVNINNYKRSRVIELYALKYISLAMCFKIDLENIQVVI